MKTMGETQAKQARCRGRRGLPRRCLPYRPRDPKRYRPSIGVIGCGGITKWHLTAYKNAGYNVAALCDIDRARAEMRRKEFYPDAFVTDDLADVLSRDDIEVVDITTHPPQRPPLIEAALMARKHVLSQKPFVLDLDEGERLADLADRDGRPAGGESKCALGAALQLHSRGGAGRPVGLDRRSALRRALGSQLGQRHGVRNGSPPDPVRLRHPLVRLSGDDHARCVAAPRVCFDGPVGDARRSLRRCWLKR